MSAIIKKFNKKQAQTQNLNCAENQKICINLNNILDIEMFLTDYAFNLNINKVTF